MADHQQSLAETWQEIKAELLNQSERPDSSIPTFTHQQRAFLGLVQPIVLVDGYAVLATPHAMAKQVIEDDFGPHIVKVLTERTGRPCSLAVSVEPAAMPAPQTPQPPIQTSVPGVQEQLGWDTTHTPPPAPAPAAPTQTYVQPVQQVQAPQPQPSAPVYHQSQRLPRETPAHDPNREKSLNPKYTFENFVIGSSNRFANGAAVAVAENPARAYNQIGRAHV